MKLNARRLLGILLLVVALSGCRDEAKIDESDLDNITRVFKTGAEHPTDPFVRAETLRIMALLEDPRLGVYGKAAQDDPEPMVRLAALRVMLKAGDPEVRQIALKGFARGKQPERLQILKAVLKDGSAPLKRELTARALRRGDATLRRLAFENGILKRVDDAITAKKEKYLNNTLYPELAGFVDRNDETIGALALKKFVEVGQTDRAEPLIRVFNREDMALEERLKAARTLSIAHAASAEPHFRKIVEAYDKSLADESLGIPGKIIPQELVRASIIGAAATGNADMVVRAKGFMRNASAEQTLFILEAIAENPSPDAEVALRVAMQDARDVIRARAIELYKARDDVQPKALVKAMYGTSYSTQRRLAVLLMAQYKDVWLDAIRERLQRQSEIEQTLRILRDVLITKEEVQNMVVPLRPKLQEILSAETDERASLAAYLLAIAADTSSEEEIAQLDKKLDDGTRYAFLEFQMRERHAASVRLFRAYINADLFAMRLVSAAGLWKLQAGEKPAEVPAKDDDANQETSEDD